jgi:hypothetical protein
MFNLFVVDNINMMKFSKKIELPLEFDFFNNIIFFNVMVNAKKFYRGRVYKILRCCPKVDRLNGSI